MHIFSFVLLTFVSASGAFLFGGGGGCGCAPPPPPMCLPQLPPLPCPPPPPPCGCLPPIQLPKLCMPQISLPSPCGCGRKKRSALLVSSSLTENLCNSPVAEVIIAKYLDSIDDIVSLPNITAPLHSELKAKTGAKWFVLCGPNTHQPSTWRGESSQFCSVTHKQATCHAFEIDV